MQHDQAFQTMLESAINAEAEPEFITLIQKFKEIVDILYKLDDFSRFGLTMGLVFKTGSGVNGEGNIVAAGPHFSITAGADQAVGTLIYTIVTEYTASLSDK